TSGQPDSIGHRPPPAHAKSAGPDESPNSSRDQRPGWDHRVGDCGRDFGRRTRCAEACTTTRLAHPRERRDDHEVVGWRLSRRASFHTATVPGIVPTLSAPHPGSGYPSETDDAPVVRQGRHHREGAAAREKPTQDTLEE